MAAAPLDQEKTDLFLSHDWGEDGITNHQKVAIINKAIKKLGYVTWFDNERMVGNIREQMAEGIENTKCFIAFITKRYHDKVAYGQDTDNCRAEFDFASMKVPMIAVVLDASMKNASDWKKNVALTLAPKLYIDLTGDINDENYLSDKLKLLGKDLKSKGVYPNPSKVDKTPRTGKGKPSEAEPNTNIETTEESQSLEQMKKKVKNLINDENFQEAIPITEEIVKEQLATLGGNHENTLNSRCSLAFCYFEQNDYQKAATIFEEVVEKRTSTLGGNHENTLYSRYWLAHCYFEQNDYLKAITIFEEVVEKRTSSLGDNHELTPRGKDILAKCSFEQNDYQEVVETQISTLGRSHENTLNSRYMLAKCYYKQKDYQKAATIFEEVVEKQTSTLGGNHGNTLKSRQWLARCYYEQKYYQKAKTFFEEVFEKATSTLGKAHDLTLKSKRQLELCSFKMRK